MKTKEEILKESLGEIRYKLNGLTTNKQIEWAMEEYASQFQQETLPKNTKEDIKNLLFLAKEMCGIHHPFLQTELYKRLSLENPTL